MIHVSRTSSTASASAKDAAHIREGLAQRKKVQKGTEADMSCANSPGHFDVLTIFDHFRLDKCLLTVYSFSQVTLRFYFVPPASSWRFCFNRL